MHINEQLWAVFLHSNPQQQAVASLVSELERYELNSENDRAWRGFVEDYVAEVLLYGYCVYQVRRGLPQILPGRFVELRLTPQRKMAPKLLPSVPRSRFPTRGWQVMVVREPAFLGTGLYKHPLSAAFKCLPQALTRIELELNLKRRDSSNSRPAVFTRIQHNIQSAPGGTRPWFTHGSLPGDISQRVDLDQLVEHRADTIRALDRVTDRAIRVTPSAAPGAKPSAAAIEHVEHAVTDGRDITEARPLHQDVNVVHHTIDRLAHEIQFAFGVPPQVQGRNINSERMASSNRLNEQAITHFRASASRLKKQLEEIFEVAEVVSFGREANRHVLDQLGHLLKPKKLVKLYALAHGLEESDFDLERVKQSTELPKKRQKTDEQKLSAALSRTPGDV